MRTIGEIPHSRCKITLFQWNGKYLIKVEQGNFEQTYKVSESDVTGDDDVVKLLNEEFLDKVLDRFKAMSLDFRQTMDNV